MFNITMAEKEQRWKVWFPGVEVGVNQYSGKYMALETQDSPGMTVHKPREQVTDQRSFQLCHESDSVQSKGQLHDDDKLFDLF